MDFHFDVEAEIAFLGSPKPLPHRSKGEIRIAKDHLVTTITRVMVVAVLPNQLVRSKGELKLQLLAVKRVEARSCNAEEEQLKRGQYGIDSQLRRVTAREALGEGFVKGLHWGL
jgi:hypothetical protein